MKTTTNNKSIKLTKESLANLQAELSDLEQNKLPAVVARIAKAREQGDLSENSEYKDAKDQQELLQVRIEEIKIILSEAVIIKAGAGAGIRVGSRITLADENGKKEYLLIGEFDKAAAEENTISVVSPLGKALVGKRAGEVVKVAIPLGEREVKIVSIK